MDMKQIMRISKKSVDCLNHQFFKKSFPHEMLRTGSNFRLKCSVSTALMTFHQVNNPLLRACIFLSGKISSKRNSPCI